MSASTTTTTTTVIERLQGEVDALKRDLDGARTAQADAVRARSALAAELAAAKSALDAARAERDAAHALAHRRDRRVAALEEEVARAREETERCVADRNILAQSLAELRVGLEEKLSALHSDVVALKDNADPLADLARHASRMERLYEAKLDTALNALATLTAATRAHGTATEQVLAECEGVLQSMQGTSTTEQTSNEYNRAKRCCTSD